MRPFVVGRRAVAGKSAGARASARGARPADVAVSRVDEWRWGKVTSSSSGGAGSTTTRGDRRAESRFGRGAVKGVLWGNGEMEATVATLL